MPTVPFDPSSPREEGSNARLDSWKQIAAYLGRGERTAKRWEVDRSLPVHRVPGGGRGSVYAFPAELDEWLNSANAEESGEASEAEVSDEAGSEADAAPSIASPPQTEALPVSVDLPAASVAGRVNGESWPIPVYLFLLVGVALAAFVVLSPRITGVRASLPFIHSRLPAKPAPAPPDAEKQLAHRLYLSGRYEWNKRSPDSLNRALDDFTQAIVHDPASAEAYVGLADTYDLMREYSLMPQSVAYTRAIAASRRAVELDDSLAEAHRSLAFALVWSSWDFQAGEKEFRRAMELDPRDPLAHLWFANAFAGPGWYPVCLREIDRAQELDPASPVILAGEGKMLFDAGQTEQGLDMLRQVEQTDPDFIAPHRYLANIYFARREYANFLIESGKTVELTRDPVLRATNAAAQAGLRRDGDRGFLLDLYIAQKRFYGEGKIEGTTFAKTCVQLGKKEEALQLLRKDYEHHDPQFLLVRTDLELLTLKDEPAYRELLTKIRLPSPDIDAARDPTAHDSTPAGPTAK
jgi:tetratricopeptide (TPR) repeat protein